MFNFSFYTSLDLIQQIKFIIHLRILLINEIYKI